MEWNVICVLQYQRRSERETCNMEATEQYEIKSSSIPIIEDILSALVKPEEKPIDNIGLWKCRFFFTFMIIFTYIPLSSLKTYIP
jgi:hypothetical protein